MKALTTILLALLALGGCSETAKEPQRMYLDCKKIENVHYKLEKLINENESFILTWTRESDGPYSLSYANESASVDQSEGRQGHDDIYYRFYNRMISSSKTGTYISAIVFNLNRITLQMSVEQIYGFENPGKENQRPTDEFNGLWYKYDCSEAERI